MKLVNLIYGNDKNREWYQAIKKTIIPMREQFLAEGGDLGDFEAYLEQQGLRVALGQLIISDEMETFMSLKMG